MEPVTKNEIIQRAIGVSRGNYIDVVRLAENLGIDVYAVDKEDDFNSAIKFDKKMGKYTILINLNHPLTRQRFSIAHELAHYALHREKIDANGLLNREQAVDEKNKAAEKEADDLAAILLMPKELIDRYFADNYIDGHTKVDSNIIAKLADYFRVSKVVATIRLRNLDFYVPFISFS